MTGRDPTFGPKRSAGEWECPECGCTNAADDEDCWQCVEAEAEEDEDKVEE